MPIRGGATLFLPPDLKPLWTSNPFYGGPELVDEDAELTALELAYDQQVAFSLIVICFLFFIGPTRAHDSLLPALNFFACPCIRSC